MPWEPYKKKERANIMFRLLLTKSEHNFLHEQSAEECTTCSGILRKSLKLYQKSVITIPKNTLS